jgi:hypothetical protein
MYDSSCHAKYALHTTVFRDSIRRLGTQRHEYLIDLIQKEYVNEIVLLFSIYLNYLYRFLDVLL